MPTLVVTAVATVLAAGAGNDAPTCLLVAAAVLTGQLTVAWSNDRFDVHRDRRVGHGGKPVAERRVRLGVVDTALAVASVVTVTLSLLLGWRAGGVHLAALVLAWLYNARLSRTWLSWLPYAGAFAALPAVATLALPQRPAPAGWAVLAAGLLGAAINLLNAMQTLSADPRSEFRGLPDRLGARPSLVLGGLLVLLAGAVVTWGPPRPPGPVAWAGLGLAVAGGLVQAPLLWRRAATRAPFFGLLGLAPVELAVAVLHGHPLH